MRHSARPALLAGLVLLALSWLGCEPDDDDLDAARFPLIPLPADLDPGRGQLALTPETRVVVVAGGEDAAALREVVERWAAPLRQASGLPLPVVGEDEASGRGHVRVVLEEEDDDERDAGEAAVAPGSGLPGVRAESYELEVTRRGAELEAAAPAGVYYGLRTLGQLIPGLGPRVGAGGASAPGANPATASATDALSPWSIPAVEIEDVPRFPYRGMHLDVGRHFFGVEFVKRYVDLLAAYKMNVFHWHLTEDQGWRIEILGYPRLTEVGSCRAETILEKNFDPYLGDGVPHCGFYTQDEIREVVAYARERFITVIPEIEMPGHSVAALAAYPELACTPGPFQVHTRWGVTRDIYCPKEETFTFLEAVLTEVMGLFPSRYVHIGGDEAPKAAWEESEVAQEVMRREGLADEEELQSWFIRRIEAFLNAHGRRLVGWDEILEGGLAPDATVMSWRGEAGGIAAARDGHDVIMTPNADVYLDHYQGDTIQEPLAIGGFSPLEEVYAYEPVPAELTPLEARHVLGAQGNVWTEYMGTSEHVEYMVLPRMLALAEVVWSPPQERCWEGFMGRLPRHLAALDGAGINYRIPEPLGLERDRLTLEDTFPLEMVAPVLGGTIRYTLDGSEPGTGSAQYTGPILLPVTEEGVTVTARVVLPGGRQGPWRRATFARTRLAAPTSLPGSMRAPGLAVEGFAGRFRSVDGLESGEVISLAADPGGASSIATISIPSGAPASPFGLRLTGYVRVPRGGIYTFTLASDDGSRLRIANRVVVDNDGPHGLAEKAGQVALHRGWHEVEIRYFQGGGDRGLRLEVEGPGVSRREVPAGWLAHPASVGGRSPGQP